MNLQARTAVAFEAACESISSRWAASGRTSDDTRLLEYQSFELIADNLDNEMEALWAPRQLLLKRSGPPTRGNPFLEGLRIIFARKSKQLDSKTREHIAVRLEYAYKHFVPPPFLNSFLAPLSRRPNRDEIEPGFEDWIASILRWTNFEPGSRGNYPASVISGSVSINPGRYSLLLRTMLESQPEMRESLLQDLDEFVRDADGRIIFSI